MLCTTASRSSRRSPRRDLALPWITGNPHSLYARVRAIRAGGGTSPWSADYGFDVVPPAPPTSMSSYNGLLRWSPVQGATGYEVWLLDAGKIKRLNTNVFDEREFYGSPAWTGNVRWRVRADRLNVVGRINGMPVSTHGAWSPIYTTNGTASADAPISLVGTVSESFSDGSTASSAHKLMPGFVWTGNRDPLTERRPPSSASKCSPTAAASTGSGRCHGRVAGLRAALVRKRHALGPNFTLDGDALTPNEDV